MAYTKANLLDDVAGVAGTEKATAERVLAAFFDAVVSQTTNGNKVSWPGFGSFSLVERGPRTGRNPQTGVSVNIPATKAMKFTASSVLKEAVNAKPAKGSGAKKAAGSKRAPASKAGTEGPAVTKSTRTSKKR